MTTAPPAYTGRRITREDGDRTAPHRDLAHRVFAISTAIGLLHALDDAVLNRQPGVPVTQHLPALLVVTALAVTGVLLFGRLRTGLRAAMALLFGGAALANGALHVMHISVDGPSSSDITGVLAAAAGVVMLVMAAALPFLHRGERQVSARRRWAVRGVAVVATAVMVFYIVMPIAVGIGQTHLFRDPIGAPPGGAYETVTFDSRDGLELSGWYSPSRNGAAVILVNSAGGDRLGSVQHARMLADHGYGVLLYDARGAGRSEGSPNGYGWDWRHDVAGAIDFLGTRTDVDPGRIGALGLSTGADVLIEVGAEDKRLKAIVADGATASSFSDIPPADRWANAYMAPVIATAALLSGSTPPPRLAELAAQVSPTPLLLIAAGSIPMEIAMNRVYAEAAEEPVELWELPDANHTAAIRDEAAAYEQRVIAHFDEALLGPS